MDEQTRDKLKRLQDAGLEIADHLTEEDKKRLASLSEEEIKALAGIFQKVGAGFSFHPGRPVTDVQKKAR
jgi:hypothetical protein